MALRLPIYLLACLAVTCCPMARSRAAQTKDALTVREAAGSPSQHRLLRGHRGRVTSLTYSPDGRRLASVSEDGTVKVWTVASGRCLSTLRLRARRALFLRDG